MVFTRVPVKLLIACSTSLSFARTRVAVEAGSEAGLTVFEIAIIGLYAGSPAGRDAKRGSPPGALPAPDRVRMITTRNTASSSYIVLKYLERDSYEHRIELRCFVFFSFLRGPMGPGVHEKTLRIPSTLPSFCLANET